MFSIALFSYLKPQMYFKDYSMQIFFETKPTKKYLCKLLARELIMKKNLQGMKMK